MGMISSSSLCGGDGELGSGGVVVYLAGVVQGIGGRWEGNKLNFPFLLVKVTCCSRLTYERVCWEQM